MEETAAALVGFYPAFSPLFPPTPFSLFLSLFSLPLFFISNNFIFYLSIPLCVPSMPVFKVHLLPLPPLTPVSADSRAVSSSATHTRTCLHKGRKKKNFCVTNDAAQCILFQYRKKSDSYLKIFFCFCFFFSAFWFKCCKKHKLLSVCQDLHPKWNYYYGVGCVFV